MKTIQIKAIRTFKGGSQETVFEGGLGKDATPNMYKLQAAKLQDDFDRDCDPVRVYVYEDNVPVWAARSAKMNLCRIKQMTDGGVYGKAA